MSPPLTVAGATRSAGAPAASKPRSFDPTTDLDAVVDLFRQLGYPADARTLRARSHSSSADAAQVLVTEVDGRVAGVLVLHVVAPWHEPTSWAIVSALVVDESVRSSGAGGRLITAAEEAARARHCSHIELSSSEARLRAHAFYERQGFSEVRKRFVKRLAA